MKRKGPTTRQLLAEQANGKTIRPVFGLTRALAHQPRTKFDPQPWTDGFFRYKSVECEATES